MYQAADAVLSQSYAVCSPLGVTACPAAPNPHFGHLLPHAGTTGACVPIQTCCHVVDAAAATSVAAATCSMALSRQQQQSEQILRGRQLAAVPSCMILLPLAWSLHIIDDS